MSRVLSALRQSAGTQLAQDICGLLAIGSFIVVGYFACAAIVMLRAGQ